MDKQHKEEIPSKENTHEEDSDKTKGEDTARVVQKEHKDRTMERTFTTHSNAKYVTRRDMTVHFTVLSSLSLFQEEPM